MTQTPEIETIAAEALVRMRQLVKWSNDPVGDPEMDHSEADEVLCSVLRSHGHHELVDEWEKVKKWYA